MDKKYIIDTIALSVETHRDITKFITSEEFSDIPVQTQALYVAVVNCFSALTVACQGIEYDFTSREDKPEDDFAVEDTLIN
mgnify:CR=1 FL=1